jgi:hypothetical protein
MYLHLTCLLLSRSASQREITRGDYLAYKFFASAYIVDPELAAVFMLVSCFTHSYTLKVVSIYSSEASVHFHRTKRLTCNMRGGEKHLYSVSQNYVNINGLFSSCR